MFCSWNVGISAKRGVCLLSDRVPQMSAKERSEAAVQIKKLTANKSFILFIIIVKKKKKKREKKEKEKS